MNILIDDLPGAALIQAGLADVQQKLETVAACLVKIASPKLRRCGFAMEVEEEDALNADHRLYALLSHEHGREAHSRYNALLRELVSFERALERRIAR